MKKILVPTDFSEQAEKALEVAAQLAKRHNSEIHLLNVLDLPLHEVDALSTHSDLPEAMFFMKLAHQKFKVLKDKEYLEGIIVHENVEFNDIFRAIYHVCKKNAIDLVIMGSHGVTGFKELFIGSNTEKVVRTSEVPVLVVKKRHTHFKIETFVFASDFMEESMASYKRAIAFANLFNAEIHLLLVVTANKFITTTEANERIHSFLGDSNTYNFHVYNDETIEKGIMNFSQSIGADLIGMGTHGRQGLSHFLNGSISEDLVNHAKRPVITFKI